MTRAPSMYEMEGASSVSAHQGRQSPGRSGPQDLPAGARHQRDSPVTRTFPPPGVTPGWCPFPTVRYFYRFGGWPARAIPGLFSVVFLSTLFSQIAARFPQPGMVIHVITNTFSTA